MENKYYTPTIEELHHGFEFEFLDSGEWTPVVYSDGGSYSHGSGYIGIEHLFSENIIRVKRLDRQDIEESGFEFIREEEDVVFYGNLNRLPLELTYDKWTKLSRIQSSHPDYRAVFFEGNIKNKSELLKIIKMIGIKN